mgnify:CR=1 FL=1
MPDITSNIFGPAELGSKGSALLVDPYDTAEIKKAMIKIITDNNFRSELIRKGLARAQEFSWDKTAGTTLKLINSICSDEKG